MRERVLEAVVEAIRQVFSDSDLPIRAEETAGSPGMETQVIASVGLAGDIKGIIMLCTDQPGARAIARGMAAGVRVPVDGGILSEIELAALGEIANQVAGRAVTILSGRGLRCEITPPAVVAAAHLQSLVPDLQESLLRRFGGPFGRLEVFLGVQHSDYAASHPKN